MARPEGETKKDRRRQWGLGITVVIALLSIVSNVVLEAQSIRSQNNHHAQSVKQDNEIIGLQKQLISLQTANNALGVEHSQDIENESQLLRGITAADKELDALGYYLYESNVANCKNSAAAAKAAGVPVVSCPTIAKQKPLTSIKH